MQTFLPYYDFRDCARVLDNKRLNKQITEALQILDTLERDDPKRGWWNHPAVRMWDGYEITLMYYIECMQIEWFRRGFTSHNIRLDYDRSLHQEPWWQGHKILCHSHQANLVRKLPEHYGKFFPNVEPAEGYWWPVALGKTSLKHKKMWEENWRR